MIVGGSLVRNARFGDFDTRLLEEVACVTKRSFWRLGASLLEDVSCETFGDFDTRLLEEVSYETLVLETLTRDFWRKSRSQRSFWRLGASLLEEVSRTTLVLETWSFTFGGSLVRNARFGALAVHFWRKSRAKRSFWRLGASPLEEVSCETLVLETWRFTFGGRLVRNARFGDLARHFWRKSRAKVLLRRRAGLAGALET